jgi:hypothetical protein
MERKAYPSDVSDDAWALLISQDLREASFRLSHDVSCVEVLFSNFYERKKGEERLLPACVLWHLGKSNALLELVRALQ